MSFGMHTQITVNTTLRDCFYGSGKGHMSLRPFFYSGRGAIRSDLNSDHLEAHWKCIKDNEAENPDPETQFPIGAANAFVQMVASIPKLSATDYLKCLHALCRNGWVWENALLGDIGVSGISVNKDDDPALGAVGLFGALFGDNNQDETGWIRGDFLRRRGIEARRGQGSMSKARFKHDAGSGYYYCEDCDSQGRHSMLVQKEPPWSDEDE